MGKYIVYTDGGCNPNPGGPGGCGVVILHDDTVTKRSYGYISSTNNRMEMRAVMHALAEIPKGSEIDLYSDSQYVLRTLNGEYSRNKNTDLWWQLDDLVKDAKKIRYHWVKGHDGNEYNEICDQLATDGQMNPVLVDEGYHGEARPIVKSAFQQTKIPAELFSVYCSNPMLNKLNAVGRRNLDRFIRASGHPFKAYLALKTGGMDKVSRESEKNLKEAAGQKNYKVIKEYFEGKDILTCMRWFVRGLSLGDAIRKVQVDLEVTQNAINSSVKSMFY